MSLQHMWRIHDEYWANGSYEDNEAEWAEEERGRGYLWAEGK